MARIPITDIPNAPDAGAPVLASQLPGVSDAVPVNVSPGLDGSGLQRAQGILASASDSISRSSANIARATAGNKRDLIDPAPFTAGGKAMEFVGEALQHAGGVATGFANDMMRAKEDMDMTRVDGILRDARDQHQLEIEQSALSPDKWVPTWNEKQAGVMEKIEALKISPRIKGRVAADVSQFWAEQTNRFALDATHRSISDARDESKVAIERAFDDGDWEIADKLITEKVGSKLFSESEGEQLRMQLESKQRDNLVNTAISADPKAVLDEMEFAKQAGHSEAFPWLDAAQRIRVEGMARTQFRQQQINAVESADASIISGEFTTPEQVQKFGDENDLDVSDIESLKKSLLVNVASTPEAQARYKTALNGLDAKVEAYDPTADPNGEKYRDLVSEVRSTALEGDRKYFLDNLSQTRREGLKPNADIQKGLIDFADQLQKQGLLNSAGYEVKGESLKVVKGKEQEALQSASDQAALKDRVRALMKENPGISAEEARKKFTEIVGGSAASGAAKLFQQPQEKSGWFNHWYNYAFPFDTVAVGVGGLLREKFQSQPKEDQSMSTTKNTASTIVNYEARRDGAGKIKLYKLPAGDGGGTFEVAGINDRYHPEMASRLKSLIEQGKQDQAEQEAADYIANYTAPVANKATNAGVRFAIQDAAFNRGLVGATKILQQALGFEGDAVDGKFGQDTKRALEQAEKDPKSLIEKFRKAREWYERNVVKRDESSKFWKGLVNRWNNQERDALAMA